tara:strand:- start:2745 stop:3404 length:660 start_codon:yes stop_codon:yes gene_type:complete
MAKQLLSEKQKWQIQNPIVLTADEILFLNENPLNENNKWKDNTFKPIKDRIRNYYHEHQNGTCAYCRLPINGGTDNIEIEHIIDKNRRVDFTFEPLNLVVSCHNCNFSKKTKPVMNLCPPENTYPTNGNNFEIIHGHFDDYFANIEFKQNSLYHALTIKGEHTIKKCSLDRLKLAEQREEVIMYQDDEIISEVIELRNSGDYEDELNVILEKLREIRNR